MNPPQTNETARVEAFSDGVFSIVITLLVFNLRVPPRDTTGEGSLLAQLALQWPTYLGFLASFGFILVMWLNHHRLFSLITKSDSGLMLFNGLLLLGVAVVPFTTQLVSEYLVAPQGREAAVVFFAWFVLVALMFNALWWYAVNSNQLFQNSSNPSLVRHIAQQYSVGPIMYISLLVISLINVPIGVIGSLVPMIFFALPNKTIQNYLEEQEAKEK
jgi:uncharacterized membrane protein